MKKPDAVTVIEKETFRDKVWGLPAADLLGVGRATQRVLDNYCIRTIGDLAQTDPDFLKRRLGKNGIALWQYANGNDHSLVHKADFVSPIKSVGHGITTVEDLEENEQVWPVFLELTQDIGHKLRVHQKCADGVAIHIRDSLRHSSITYKLKLNGGDMKSVQGDSGHAQVKMVADVYSHIIDEDRRVNAQRFEENFYRRKEETQTPSQSAEVQKNDDNAELVAQLMANPELLAVMKTVLENYKPKN